MLQDSPPSRHLELNMFFRASIALGVLLLAGLAAADDGRNPGSALPAGSVQVAQSGTAGGRAFNAPASTAGHLSVRGQDIVDPSGRPILLRGWNWGHFGKAIEQDAADNAAQGANVVRIPIRW